MEDPPCAEGDELPWIEGDEEIERELGSVLLDVSQDDEEAED